MATIVGVLLAGAALLFTWHTHEKETATKIRVLLDEANDALNGGKPGSEYIQDPQGLTSDRLAHLEIAKRKIYQALELDSRNSRAHDALGLYYCLRGRWEEAKHEFELSIRFDPTMPDPHVNLGQLLLERHMPEPALQEFEAAKQLSPSYVPAYAGIAETLMVLYESKMASPRPLPPTNLGGLTAIGVLFPEMRNAEFGPDPPTSDEDAKTLERAARELETAVKLDANRPELYRMLGNVRDLQAETEAAIASYERALTLDPDDPYTHYDYGVALLWAKDCSGGVREFLRAVGAYPGYARAWAMLGIAYRHRGDDERSIAAFLEALRLDPESRIAKWFLGKWFGERTSEIQAMKDLVADGDATFAALAAPPSNSPLQPTSTAPPCG